MSEFKELIKSFPKTREYVRTSLSMVSRQGRNSKKRVPEPMIMNVGGLKAGFPALSNVIIRQKAKISLLPLTAIC